MIALFSDFSVSDPYVGLMKMAIYQRAADCRVIDICHDLPEFNPNAAGRLLQMMVRDLPQETIILAVVDPGVGTARHPLWLTVDGRHYLGPDNGLFARIMNQANEVEARIIEYDTNSVSATFHGRDVFAPAAAQIEIGATPAAHSVRPENLIGRDWPDELSEIIYIDHYGNAMTGIEGAQIPEEMLFQLNGVEFMYEITFENEAIERPFWYINSIGLVELAHYRQSIAERYDIKIGDIIRPVSS